MQGFRDGLSESEEDSGLEHFAQVGVGGVSGAVLGPASAFLGELVLFKAWMTMVG